MHPAALADADLVWLVSGAPGHDRASPRALVRLDYRPVGEGSLLHTACPDGPFHVFLLEDDTHDRDRSAATGHDEVHAHWDGGALHDNPLSQWPRSVYSHQRRSGGRAAVVPESQTSHGA